MDTLLPLASAAFIPFIPNDALRFVAMGIAVVSFAGHLVHRISPRRQVGTLEVVTKNIEDIFDMATKECARDPQFIYTAELKLNEIKYAVSSLRTKTIEMENIPWNEYFKYRRGFAMSVKQCRQQMQDLQSSITTALESARRRKYKEDIDHRKAILDRMFTAGEADGGQALRTRPSGFVMVRDEV